MPIEYSIGDLFSSMDRQCKLKVIHDIDTPIIDKFVTDNFAEKCSLTYFGLAGANLTDLIHWGEYIKKGVVIEKYTNVYHQQIRSLFSENLHKKFSSCEDIAIVKHDIDDLLDINKDNSLGKNSILDSFLPFTLINLDYYGSVIAASQKTGIMRRIELLKNLFEIQRSQDIRAKYLLLLTIYHAGIDEEPETGDSQLIEKIKEARYRDKYETIVDKIIELNKRIPLLSIAVPIFIAEAASSKHTILEVKDKIAYRDSSYWMIHFVFQLEAKKGQSPNVKKKNIFTTPLKIVEKQSECDLIIKEVDLDHYE